MEQEEYIVDGHKVTHSVHLGDREIFLAVQQDAPLPFYVGYMEVSYELGLARFSGLEGTTEYTEAWEMFIQRLQKQIEQVRAQRQEHHAPQLLTEADCIRDSRAGDYEGKVLECAPAFCARNTGTRPTSCILQWTATARVPAATAQRCSASTYIPGSIHISAART